MTAAAARPKRKQPYQPGRDWSVWEPRNGIWRVKVYIDAQFSGGMMEAWEQVAWTIVMVSLLSLLWYSLYWHFPSHARTVVRRASYYIFGSSDARTAKGFVRPDDFVRAEEL